MERGGLFRISDSEFRMAGLGLGRDRGLVGGLLTAVGTRHKIVPASVVCEQGTPLNAAVDDVMERPDRRFRTESGRASTRGQLGIRTGQRNFMNDAMLCVVYSER
jgi:hypothetical protein